ncbi:hypothetical protein [Sinorhizobium meliloti]|uniref:hypothetical protein n=1 Tax=Rhizobium meliloti TaxID=382 RepID=UPI00299DD7F1
MFSTAVLLDEATTISNPVRPGIKIEMDAVVPSAKLIVLLRPWKADCGWGNSASIRARFTTLSAMTSPQQGRLARARRAVDRKQPTIVEAAGRIYRKLLHEAHGVVGFARPAAAIDMPGMESLQKSGPPRFGIEVETPFIRNRGQVLPERFRHITPANDGDRPFEILQIKAVQDAYLVFDIGILIFFPVIIGWSFGVSGRFQLWRGRCPPLVPKADFDQGRRPALPWRKAGPILQKVVQGKDFRGGERLIANGVSGPIELALRREIPQQFRQAPLAVGKGSGRECGKVPFADAPERPGQRGD